MVFWGMAAPSRLVQSHKLMVIDEFLTITLSWNYKSPDVETIPLSSNPTTSIFGRVMVDKDTFSRILEKIYGARLHYTFIDI